MESCKLMFEYSERNKERPLPSLAVMGIISVR